MLICIGDGIRDSLFIIYVVPAFLLIDAIAAAILIALWAKEQRK